MATAPSKPSLQTARSDSCEGEQLERDRACDGQTHLNDERRLWVPLAVRTELRPRDRFFQGARRRNSFKACKKEEKKSKQATHKKPERFEHCYL